MPSALAPRRRMPALLAVAALVAGSVLPVAASNAPGSPSASGPAAATAASDLAHLERARIAEAARRAAGVVDVRRAPRRAVVRAPAAGSVAVRAERPAPVVPAAISVPVAPVGAEPKAPAVAPPKPVRTGTSSGYSGRNHVWIPSLGISRSIEFFPCTRATPPGHRVYRWGCAGSNNVYLFGHASSVMKPLHDLYVAGRLRAGMTAVFADGNGRVRTYSVVYWKVVAPDGDIGWAYAGQARPSMTLQTCVGTNSEKRLVVRLAAVG